VFETTVILRCRALTRLPNPVTVFRRGTVTGYIVAERKLVQTNNICQPKGWDRFGQKVEIVPIKVEITPFLGAMMLLEWRVAAFG
jgi:hypothetical protein